MESFTYLVGEGQEVAVGRRVKASFGRREALGYIIACHEEVPDHIERDKLKTLTRVVDKESLFGEKETALARWIAGYYLCSPGEALAAMVPSAKREISLPAVLDEDIEISREPLPLSEEQRAALEAILEDPAKKGSAEGADTKAADPWFYLYGITGSGKTEVFLRAAEEVISAGKSVIYLVPEISLTHQVIEAIRERFGAQSATLHSHLTASQRLAEWQRIRRGEARIVAGPRSAIFAPVGKLGLVIIDEEHDSSYKSGNTPRYHARQVALYRSKTEGARVLMGSATPSVEAWKLMAEGTITRLDLTRRLSGGAPPAIEIVKLSRDEGSLSQRLKEEIHETALAGRQSILFLNRRGFNLFYACPDCGFELRCRQCSVALTWHKAMSRAVCHYCGYSVPLPRSCPQCGSLAAGFTGFGTEMVEDELARSFPKLRIKRLDTDVATKRDQLKGTLDAFRAGEIDVLLGTQMVAKGLNFPGVRLVGVVLADTGLQLPDFRAAERTFSLIVQVAGRAGRFFPDGRVLVQAWRPEAAAIQLACALDLERFYQHELEAREAAGFPPFTRLIRIVCRAKDKESCEETIGALNLELEAALPGEADILGPVECPLSRIAGNWRMHLIVRAAGMGSIHGPVARTLARFRQTRRSGVYLEVDMDPVSLL